MQFGRSNRGYASIVLVSALGLAACDEPLIEKADIEDVIDADVGDFIDCGQSGITCLGSTKPATQVHCNCECGVPGPFDGIDGHVAACLPAALNPAIVCNNPPMGAGGAGGAAGEDGASGSATEDNAALCSELTDALSAMSQQDYDQELESFCAGAVENFVEVGMRNQHNDLNCECHAEGVEVSEVCTSPCEPQLCAPNCGPLWDEKVGLTSLLGCINGCNQLRDGLVSTTDAICSASPVLSSVPIAMLRSESLVSIAHPSHAHLRVFFEDDLGFDHSDEDDSELTGMVRLFGRRRADGTADLGLDLTLTGTDVEFNFDNVDLIGDIDAPFRKIRISGETAYNAIPFASNGLGLIPTGALTLRIDLFVGSRHILVTRTNEQPLSVIVDFDAKTFSLPSVPIDAGSGVTGSIVLDGLILNQPPTARAGDDFVAECQSPAGAEVTLNGETSDPDDSLASRGWYAGLFDWNGSEPLTNELSTVVLAPFNPPAQTSLYSLLVTDSMLQTDRDEVEVTVQDTTGPSLDVVATTECLWAPAHKLVLFEPGAGFQLTSSDACDAAPTWQVEGVTSSQPQDGSGDGHSAPDFIAGAQSFCLRAERQGTSKQPRKYQISFGSTDASGNVTSRTIEVAVGHDQASLPCGKVPRERLVADDDPRCSEGGSDAP